MAKKDINEAINKNTKMAFAQTKKQPDILVAQLPTKQISNLLPSYMKGVEYDCVLIENARQIAHVTIMMSFVRWTKAQMY